jgi:hypothetical protein
VILIIPGGEKRFRKPTEYPLETINQAIAKEYEGSHQVGDLTDVDDPGPKGMAGQICTCGFNFLDTDFFFNLLCDYQWHYPENVQLLVSAEWCGHDRYQYITVDRLRAEGWPELKYKRSS